MRVLVTGAQGCIGAWVVKVLLQRGVDVVLYDADPNPVRLSLLLAPERLSRIPLEVGKIEDTARLQAGETILIQGGAGGVAGCGPGPE